MELALALVAAAVPQVQVRSAKFGTRMAELTLRFMCAICLDLRHIGSYQRRGQLHFDQ